MARLGMISSIFEISRSPHSQIMDDGSFEGMDDGGLNMVDCGHSRHRKCFTAFDFDVETSTVWCRFWCRDKHSLISRQAQFWCGDKHSWRGFGGASFGGWWRSQEMFYRFPFWCLDKHSLRGFGVLVLMDDGARRFPPNPIIHDSWMMDRLRPSIIHTSL